MGEIVEEAGKRYPVYSRLIDGLNIRGNIWAMEALAELIPYLDQPMGFRKMINLLGLFRPPRGRKKIYSGHLRRALQRLTASVNNIKSFQLTTEKGKCSQESGGCIDRKPWGGWPCRRRDKTRAVGMMRILTRTTLLGAAI